VLSLILIGLALGMDSFRVSLGLGTLRLNRSRQIFSSISFGICDALASLAGGILGQSTQSLVGPWARFAGPMALGAYGIYVIHLAHRCQEKEHEIGWFTFGLPAVMSLDNAIAGIGLAMLRFPILISAAVIGLMSGGLAIAGMCLGQWIGERMPVKAKWLSGAVLVGMALSLALHGD
jgi:putative Mn2+ efflux pump MntP